MFLTRVLQTWKDSAVAAGDTISERTFWGVVYAMAIGVNYGAFSLSFASSLAGLGWREDLAAMRIYVRSLEFLRVNMPLIITSMTISCSVLLGQAYIVWE